MLNLGKREILAQTLDAFKLHRMLTIAPLRQKLLVFNYHRIGEPGVDSLDQGLFSATPAQFAAQVEYLTSHFQVIGLSELTTGADWRAKPQVMITFDDGYRDNFELAVPILKALNAKAVFFISTGFIDAPRLSWWDRIAWMVNHNRRADIPASKWVSETLSCINGYRIPTTEQLLHTYKHLPGSETAPFMAYLEQVTGAKPDEREADQLWMTWEMIHSMRAAGMDIGAHTVNHPVLANESEETQRWEITESKRRLEQELGQPMTAFSYPVGSAYAFNERTKTLVQEAGFEWAFSFGHEADWDGRDRWQIPRVAVERDVSLSRFRAISTWPGLFAK